MSNRRTHSPEFQSRAGMEAISDRKSIQEIAADHSIDPIHVSQWKKQQLDAASELLMRGKKSKQKEKHQAKDAELFQQSGKLQMELEWQKKYLSCFDAHELSKVVDSDSSELSINRQCALLGLPLLTHITGRHRCGHRGCASWLESMLSTWRIRTAVAAGWLRSWPGKASR